MNWLALVASLCWSSQLLGFRTCDRWSHSTPSWWLPLNSMIMLLNGVQSWTNKHNKLDISQPSTNLVNLTTDSDSGCQNTSKDTPLKFFPQVVVLDRIFGLQNLWLCWAKIRCFWGLMVNLLGRYQTIGMRKARISLGSLKLIVYSDWL